MASLRTTRRSFIKQAGLGCIGLFPVFSRAKAKPEWPNILWITCEDISPHLGCYGDPDAYTPHLDQFAGQGVLYENAFAPAPACTPARSSLITGVFATAMGSQHLRGEVPISTSLRCYPEYLREAGYFCTNNVKEDYNLKIGECCMQSVVLDGTTLNPGDLSWQALEALGPCTIYDRTAADEVVARAQGADIVLTNKTPMSKESIEALDSLRFIGVLATGYNIVDTVAARERGIAVANVPTYGTDSVAQAAFCHVLNLTHHVGEHARTVQEGKWSQSVDFCYWDFPLIELKDRVMGIVGLGRIGRATAKLALAFGMQVLAYDVHPPTDVPRGVTMVDLDRLFVESDVVSLHCPLTDESKGMINQARLTQMKPTSFLVNTSRGPLVNEQDLADALNAGLISGAGLDVLTVEPADPACPLLTVKNCYISPHIAWASGAARKRLMDTTVSNVEAFIQGRPQNIVN
jgi:glycerate dehydrogenase